MCTAGILKSLRVQNVSAKEFLQVTDLLRINLSNKQKRLQPPWKRREVLVEELMPSSFYFKCRNRTLSGDLWGCMYRTVGGDLWGWMYKTQLSVRDGLKVSYPHSLFQPVHQAT